MGSQTDGIEEVDGAGGALAPAREGSGGGAPPTGTFDQEVNVQTDIVEVVQAAVVGSEAAAGDRDQAQRDGSPDDDKCDDQGFTQAKQPKKKSKWKKLDWATPAVAVAPAPRGQLDPKGQQWKSAHHWHQGLQLFLEVAEPSGYDADARGLLAKLLLGPPPGVDEGALDSLKACL